MKGWSRMGCVFGAAWVLACLVAACGKNSSTVEPDEAGGAAEDRAGATGGSGDSESVGGSANPDSSAHPAPAMPRDTAVVFLHHSTGGVVWEGGVADWFERHNSDHATSYRIEERAFPADAPYGWNNYPYDYWNIWVQHAGSEPYLEEPTLEILTWSYQVIVFKHCFPVSQVTEDQGAADVTSEARSRQNYELQYAALKTKLRSFSSTRFIVWTGAALVESATNQAEAERARSFFRWVKQTWDEPGDNIYVWDFWQLETGGGLYLLPENAASADDSHPNSALASRAAPLFAQRVVDVIEGRGDTGSVTGE